MNEEPIQYLGERLWAGELGNILIILSFVSVLVASVSWFFAAQRPQEQGWKAIARISFSVHSFALFSAIGLLFAMIIGGYFEYHYVWHHSNSAMQLKYVFSCFWEGQEGSFLLWAFWHSVIGNILYRVARSWESSVMAIYSLVQAFLMTMVLGTVILDYKIGSNPFTILLREHPDFANLPMFNNADYLTRGTLDGRGLNPLLQNYWMTIHPPTLFLGFASTLVPFAYAIAALWKRRYSEWLKPCLPWAFFGVGVLGTGILMGGAWAYEALSFGGFWAWDPVENASLVPWLTFVGAAHLMLINRNKGTSLRFAFALTIVTFVLILYSTFLTRSGILGDASVHAFTDLGMNQQLLLYLLTFLGIGVVLMLVRWRDMPKLKEEEAFLSREFWMLIGSVVLLLSALQITISTSLPVINKIFETNFAPPSDIADHYHRWQVPLAIILSLMVGFGQFLKYKKTNTKEFFSKLMISFAVTAGLTTWIAIVMEFENAYNIALLATSLFAIVGNSDYLIRIMKGRIPKAGASVAHVGFGMLLLGALISAGRSDTISVNSADFSVQSLSEDLSDREHLLMFVDDTLRMGDYMVAYRGRKKEGINILFEVEYMKMAADGSFESAFTLHPRVQLNKMMGNAPEPDTRHYFDRDVFTHVAWGRTSDPAEDANMEAEWQAASELAIGMGDTLPLTNCLAILDTIYSKVDTTGPVTTVDIEVDMTVLDMRGNSYKANPTFALRSSMQPEIVPAVVDEVGLRLSLIKVNPVQKGFVFAIEERQPEQPEFIVMKAIVFPWINLLWAGCLLMAIGTFIAVWNRIQLALRSARK